MPRSGCVYTVPDGRFEPDGADGYQQNGQSEAAALTHVKARYQRFFCWHNPFQFMMVLYA
jgi:hypothetical protein